MIQCHHVRLLLLPEDYHDTFSLNLEGSADQCKERSVEGHHPITVERHIHGHQTLEDINFQKPKVCQLACWQTFLPYRRLCGDRVSQNPEEVGSSEAEPLHPSV